MFLVLMFIPKFVFILFCCTPNFLEINISSQKTIAILDTKVPSYYHLCPRASQ